MFIYVSIYVYLWFIYCLSMITAFSNFLAVKVNLQSTLTSCQRIFSWDFLDMADIGRLKVDPLILCDPWGRVMGVEFRWIRWHGKKRSKGGYKQYGSWCIQYRYNIVGKDGRIDQREGRKESLGCERLTSSTGMDCLVSWNWLEVKDSYILFASLNPRVLPDAETSELGGALSNLS